MFEYVATSNGTLSNPYRHVKKGQTVSSPVALKGSWLVPKSEHKPEKDLPIMGGLKHHKKGRDALHPFNVAKPISDPHYDNAIAAIKKMEDIQDGKVPAAQPTAPAPAPDYGSGDQDVLG